MIDYSPPPSNKPPSLENYNSHFYISTRNTSTCNVCQLGDDWEPLWDGTGEDINKSNFENRPQKVILTN